jgi:hypothetical protein
VAVFDKLRRHKTPKFDSYNELWGGWDYPSPIQILGSDYHPGQDSNLKDIIYMAEYGWHYCQKVLVEMRVIYPLSDYRPDVSDEFRATFNARFKDDPMPLILYERDGKLIMGNDWETYWMYRERQDIYATCVLIGHFTQIQNIVVLDKPYMIYR